MEHIELEIKKRIAELPPEIRASIESADLDEKLRAIGKAHGLHIDQQGAVEDEAMLAMLGFIQMEDLAKGLQQQAHLNPQQAQEVAASITSEIFTPIRESMKRWAEDRKNIPEKTPAAPQAVTTGPSVVMPSSAPTPSTPAIPTPIVSSTPTPVASAAPTPKPVASIQTPIAPLTTTPTPTRTAAPVGISTSTASGIPTTPKPVVNLAAADTMLSQKTSSTIPMAPKPAAPTPTAIPSTPTAPGTTSAATAKPATPPAPQEAAPQPYKADPYREPVE